MERLLKKLEEKSLTLGSVESFTGGLFAANVTNVPGASKVFKGSIVAYHNELKQRLLNLSTQVIEQEGVVSEACAIELARNGLNLLECSICVSFTGNAGPQTLENKPVGLYYIAIVGLNKEKIYHLLSPKSRNELRQEAVLQAIQYIEEDFLG
jgi:nicotinamide-nucleotide amidase